MNMLSYWSLRIVRWSSWPLLLLILAFITTGYLISGNFGLTGVDENKALAWHKLLHYPLFALLLVHVLPALYLAVRRWGWIKL